MINQMRQRILNTTLYLSIISSICKFESPPPPIPESRVLLHSDQQNISNDQFRTLAPNSHNPATTAEAAQLLPLAGDTAVHWYLSPPSLSLFLHFRVSADSSNVVRGMLLDLLFNLNLNSIIAFFGGFSNED